MTIMKNTSRGRQVRSIRADATCANPYCQKTIIRSTPGSSHIDLSWMAYDKETQNRYDITMCNWRCLFDWLASDDAHQRGVPDLELLLAIQQYVTEARVDESILERQ